MLETRDEWINLFFDNVRNKRDIDKPAFEEGIKWLYNDLLKKPTPKIIYCDGWLSCLLTIAILKDKNLIKKSWAPVWDSVGAPVWASIRASIRASVWDSVWDSVWASIGDSVNEYSSYIDLSNYGWVSFYDFFEKINLLDNFNFKQYKKLIRSNVFNAYEYENYVFAIQPPVYIETNLAGRLHSTTQAAVQFRDGSEYYFINGRSIPAWIVNDKSSITKERFMKETDADIKGAIYESIGQQGMLDLLGAKVVDRREIVHANGDREVVELLKTNDLFKEIDNQPFAWVSMCCPSTGTHYLQGVEPHHTNAIEAIASLSPFNAKDYSFNFRA